MKYDILFWDIDGTLMDFKRAEAKALSQSLREVDVIPDRGTDFRIFSN